MASTDILVWAGEDICKTHRYAEPRPWTTRAAYSWMGIIDNTNMNWSVCVSRFVKSAHKHYENFFVVEAIALHHTLNFPHLA